MGGVLYLSDIFMDDEDGFLSDQVRSGDFKFTGNTSLAKATGRGRILQPIFQTLRLQRLGIDIFPAFILVMSLLRNGAGWTSRDAFSTFFVSELEAIFFVVTIFFLTRCQFQKSYHTPDSHGHSPGGDKAVIEAESSKTTGIGDVAFRPRRGPTHFFIPQTLNRR